MNFYEKQRRKAIVESMSSKGHSLAAIAKHIGITRESLSRWVSKNMKDWRK